MFLAFDDSITSILRKQINRVRTELWAPFKWQTIVSSVLLTHPWSLDLLFVSLCLQLNQPKLFEAKPARNLFSTRNDCCKEPAHWNWGPVVFPDRASDRHRHKPEVCWTPQSFLMNFYWIHELLEKSQWDCAHDCKEELHWSGAVSGGTALIRYVVLSCKVLEPFAASSTCTPGIHPGAEATAGAVQSVDKVQQRMSKVLFL